MAFLEKETWTVPGSEARAIFWCSNNVVSSKYWSTSCAATLPFHQRKRRVLFRICLPSMVPIQSYLTPFCSQYIFIIHSNVSYSLLTESFQWNDLPTRSPLEISGESVENSRKLLESSSQAWKRNAFFGKPVRSAESRRGISGISGISGTTSRPPTMRQQQHAQIP